MRAFPFIAWAACLCAQQARDAYGPLRFYDGTWEVHQANMAADAKADRLSNACAPLGAFFSCQQTINGNPGALLLFHTTDQPGHYFTQGILPDAHATGRGELTIAGDRWTYTGKEDLGNGRAKYHRTINQFTGHDRIHYEVAESDDGEHWSVTNSGDERRLPSCRAGR